MQHKLMKLGFILVGIMAFGALFAPWLTPYSPTELDLNNMLTAPNAEHLLGTDQLGRDVFARLLYGARVSLLVGFIAVGISSFIGILLGAISAYYGGRVDRIIMRFVDVMLCFPSFFLILAVIAFLEPSLVNIMIVIGLTSWMGVTRLVRAEFLKLKSQDFILAAKTQGLKDSTIIARYLLPNAMAPVLVNMTLSVAAAILVESGLSFLGIGVQPPNPSWGNMLIDGKANIEVAWWLSLFPGLAILITVLGYNLLGEGLRDRFDPRLRK